MPSPKERCGAQRVPQEFPAKMAAHPKISFVKPVLPTGGVAVIFVGADLASKGLGKQLIEAIGGIERAAEVAKFTGKAGSSLDILAPARTVYDRVLVFGLGDETDAAKTDWMKLGGQILGKAGAGKTTVLFDVDGASGEAAAALALGLRLRAYSFDRYKTKKKDDEEKTSDEIAIAVADEAAAKAAWKVQNAIADGVTIARNLVNEPANVLYPEEFAKRASELKEVGVDVEVLDEKALRKIGMRALLGVGQGSHHESRVVVMRWNGGKGGQAPVAFVGKGVTFDSGGISIKPSAGMEDMKGDMGGAACVVGLMHALAARKAKVNAVGVIGLVENMPDGKAQRPGDIVESLSGQTIEIINTDAEGRLVLGDVLWYTQDRFKPVFMVNLATLTGAIMVALGSENAGLFSNNDELSERLIESGLATGEKVWRMPLSAEYDKLIDSKFADMKNTGGRYGGAITAAQFLQRFVNDTPWAHLDIAGTGMSSPQTDTNRSWGSGWGVRLLNNLVAGHYEG